MEYLLDADRRFCLLHPDFDRVGVGGEQAAERERTTPRKPALTRRAMDAPLVITVVAPDRPGLVESLAGAIASHSGNWLESRMSRLGGQFAGILRITVPRNEREKLIAALRSLEQGGLKITIQADEPKAVTPAGKIAELTLVGQDRPGIVRQVSQAFARSGVNVEDLETECSSAPMSGETLFHARARVQIPPSCDMAALRQEFEKIASDLMVDAQLTEV